MQEWQHSNCLDKKKNTFFKRNRSKSQVSRFVSPLNAKMNEIFNNY